MVDTSQKTESIQEIVESVDKGAILLPEFQRDFVWDESKTYDLFDSLVRNIFIGSLIYGIPSFEITVRHIDARPRRGKGSRTKLQLKSFTKKEITALTKTSGFRLLLDGQQRVTSICRALRGPDNVWIIFKDQLELEKNVLNQDPDDRDLEDIVFEVAGKESDERLSILLSDVYLFMIGKISREKEKAEKLAETAYVASLEIDNIGDSQVFEDFLLGAKKLENLLRSEKLLSYYLLDTDEEKFALFFERSNTKGIQLNFIDILAAKLYVGFNLREHIERFNRDNPDLLLSRETVVRAIAYVHGKDVGRKYILENLTHEHFSTSWDEMSSLYKKAFDYLYTNHFLISQNWLPYENLIIPLMIFLKEIPSQDFSQIDEKQAKFIKWWYWSSIFSQRYSAGANQKIANDAAVLQLVGGGNYSFQPSYFSRFSYQFDDAEDLKTVSKKGNAVYKGILNIYNYRSGGLRDLKNNDLLHENSKLEDHHIFPKDYLRSTDKEMDANLIDSVLNRTLVPKITNIQISNKKPSVYLADLGKKNSSLEGSLASHMIPEDILSGMYDDIYEIFVEERGKAVTTFIFDEIRELGGQLRDELFPPTDEETDAA